MAVVQRPLPTSGVSPEPDPADADLLFKEAKQREHKRRLLWLGVAVVALGATAGGYLTATNSSPHPESLVTRPLHFPSVAAGESCPATPGHPVHTSFFDGVALGNGPVRVLVGNHGDLLRGQADLGTSQAHGWFALEMIWFSVPGYDGPFVVRAKRLGASGPIRVKPGDAGTVPGSGPLVVPAGPTINTQDGYRTVPGSTWVTSSGCYAWQIDGQNFSEVITVDALSP